MGGIDVSEQRSRFETVLKQIQKSVSLVPVIVLGSGASAAYGYAGMAELAGYLRETIVPIRRMKRNGTSSPPRSRAAWTWKARCKKS